MATESIQLQTKLLNEEDKGGNSGNNSFCTPGNMALLLFVSTTVLFAGLFFWAKYVLLCTFNAFQF